MNILTNVNEFKQDNARLLISSWRSSEEEYEKLTYYREKVMNELEIRLFDMPTKNPYLQAVVFKPTKRYDTWGILFMGNKKLRKIVRTMERHSTTLRRLISVDYWDDDYLFSGSPDRDTFRSHLNWAGTTYFRRYGWVFVNPRKPFSQEMIDLFVNDCHQLMSDICIQWYVDINHKITEGFELFDEMYSKVRADRSMWEQLYYDAEEHLNEIQMRTDHIIHELNR